MEKEEVKEVDLVERERTNERERDRRREGGREGVCDRVSRAKFAADMQPAI